MARPPSSNVVNTRPTTVAYLDLAVAVQLRAMTHVSNLSAQDSVWGLCMATSASQEDPVHFSPVKSSSLSAM